MFISSYVLDTVSAAVNYAFGNPTSAADSDVASAAGLDAASAAGSSDCKELRGRVSYSLTEHNSELARSMTLFKESVAALNKATYRTTCNEEDIETKINIFCSSATQVIDSCDENLEYIQHYIDACLLKIVPTDHDYIGALSDIIVIISEVEISLKMVNVRGEFSVTCFSSLKDVNEKISEVKARMLKVNESILNTKDLYKTLLENSRPEVKIFRRSKQGGLRGSY